MKFKEMNIWSKILYVLGILGVIEFIINLIYSIYTFFTSSAISNSAKQELLKYSFTLPVDDISKIMSIIIIVSSLVILIMALLDIRAAKDNSKIMLPLILESLNFILLIVSIFSSEISLANILGGIIDSICFLACIMIFINNKKTSTQ